MTRRIDEYTRHVITNLSVVWILAIAVDMGGAEYLFNGLNDANLMTNSALRSLNDANECVGKT